MNYATLCSGIEATTVAWQPLGWEPVAFSEIEPFPCDVLAHHYPTVPNKGDMLKYAEWTLPRINLLHASTPCQGFSVMGDRGGVADPRGNLTLAFIGAADHFDPDWVTWENVPGVLSMEDNAFGQLLGGLSGSPRFADSVTVGRKWPDAGVVSGPKRTVAWRVIDARNWLPQSRRRVFLVATRGSRNFRCAAALFPVSEGLRRPSTARQQPATDPFTGCSTWFRGSGPDLVPTSGDNSLCLNAGGMGRIDLETETHVVEFLHGQPQRLRALTPLECERIQGLPDGYTRVVPRNQKVDKDVSPEMVEWVRRHMDNLPGGCPNHEAHLLASAPLGPQYKAVGNSIAVPCLRYIGERIHALHYWRQQLS